MKKEDMCPTVEKAMKGDSVAFETLFNAYWNMAYFYCFKYLKNKHEAEDAAQTAFFTLFKCIGNLKNPELFVAYFSRILTNTCHNRFRARKKKSNEMVVFAESLSIIEILPEERTEFLPEELMSQHELKNEIVELINKLPKKQREVMLLHFLNGLSQSEIAVILDIKPSAVGNRLFHARAALRKSYEKLNSKGIYASVLTSTVITQVLREEMNLFAAPGVQARAWEGLQIQIGAYNIADMADSPKSQPNGSNAVNIGFVVAACATVACFGILGINYYNSVQSSEPSVDYSVVEWQTDVLDIIEELRASETLDDFTGFVLRHNFSAGQIVIWNTQAEEFEYRFYHRTFYDRTIFAGIRSGSSETLIAYQIESPGAAAPQDIMAWINENKK